MRVFFRSHHGNAAAKDQGKPPATQKTLEICQLAISELQPHPQQSLYADSTTEADDQELRESIASKGLLVPPEVLPANQAGLPEFTVLDGIRRIEALDALGENAVTVRLRYDLAEADRRKIDLTFLEYNYSRRHLDQISRAKVIAQRVALLEGCSLADVINGRHGEAVRTKAAEIFNLGPKQARRLIQLLNAPPAVQTAVRRKQLSIITGARLGSLDAIERSDVARRIDAGESPQAVAAEFLGRAEDAQTPECLVRDILKAVTTAVKGLPKEVSAIELIPEHFELESLKSCMKVCDQLMTKLEANRQLYDEDISGTCD